MTEPCCHVPVKQGLIIERFMVSGPGPEGGVAGGAGQLAGTVQWHHGILVAMQQQYWALDQSDPVDWCNRLEAVADHSIRPVNPY